MAENRDDNQEQSEHKHHDDDKKDEIHHDEQHKDGHHKDDEHKHVEKQEILSWKLKTSKTLTIALHIVNGLLILLSFAVIVTAALDLLVLATFKDVTRGRNKISDIVIIIGVLTGIALAIYGSVGALKKKRQALHVEAGGLLVLLVVLVALSAIVIVQRPTDDSILTERLHETFARATSPLSVERIGWNAVEKELKCCGVQGPMDYTLLDSPPHVPPAVALSCCTNIRDNATGTEQQHARMECIQERLFYQHGCQPLISDTFAKSTIGVIISVLILALIQVTTVIVIGTTLLRLHILEERRRYGRQVVVDIVVIFGILLGAMLAITSSLLLSDKTRMGTMAEVGGVTILVTSMLCLSALVILFLVGPYRNKKGRL